MSRTNKTINLPSDPQEIIRRLTSVNDEDTLVSRFYPMIAKDAGRQLVAEGVVIMFNLASYDFCQGYPPMISTLIQMQIPRWIDALIDDKEVVESAKQFIGEVEAKMAADAEGKKGDHQRRWSDGLNLSQRKPMPASIGTTPEASPTCYTSVIWTADGVST